MRPNAGRPTVAATTFVLLSAIAITSACVSADPGPSPPADAGAAGDTGTAAEASAPALLSCAAYCTEVAKNCGAPMDQYNSTDECLKACALLDLGASTDG